MSEKEKYTIDVWYDDECRWVKYNNEDYKNCFNFVKRPTFGSIKQIYLHNSSYNTWIDIMFHNETHAVYNKVYGTFVKI